MGLRSQPSARYRAVLLQLSHDVTDEIHGNGKAYPLIPSASGKNRRVDPNQFAPGVDQSAARVSGIDGGVGLDEVLIIFNAQSAASRCADDSHGHSLSQTKRIAHR